MSADALEQYLNAMGIIGCNVNPYLPALDDLGFCWQDMTALLDRQGLFTAKVYRRRTVYLSPEVYHLLRQLRARRPMPPDAAALHAVLGGESAPGDRGTEAALPAGRQDLRESLRLPHGAPLYYRNPQRPPSQ